MRTRRLCLRPRGTPHAFLNIGETLGQCIITFTPGGTERFFEEFSPVIRREGPPDHAAITAIFRRHDWEVVGPPLIAGTRRARRSKALRYTVLKNGHSLAKRSVSSIRALRIPGSVIEWPAFGTMTSFASGQARWRSQAERIGQTTS